MLIIRVLKHTLELQVIKQRLLLVRSEPSWGLLRRAPSYRCPGRCA